MRSRSLASLLGLLLACAPAFLRAQVEPQLDTKTDLIDVYRKDAGKPEMVVIYDFTTPSRGVFEPLSYLTAKTHASYIGGNQGVSNNYQTVFAPATLGKDFGMVFGIRSATYITADLLKTNYPTMYSRVWAGLPPPLTSLPLTYQKIPTIRMWKWPQTSAIFQQTKWDGVNNTSQDVIGVPLAYDSTTKVMLPVSGDTSTAAGLAAVIAQITHVRFKVKDSTGAFRTMDLPCPTILFDNPVPADPLFPRLSSDPNVRNWQRHSTTTGGGTVIYDPWSDANQINTATPTLTQSGKTDTIIGNFFYAFDYLGFIYGSKSVRNAASTNYTAATVALDPVMSTNGYAITDANEAFKTNPSTIPVSGSTTGEGWNNGLPNMTRYQAVKYVSANVLLDQDGKINWIYRFLDPAYPAGTVKGHPTWTSDDGDAPEELGQTSNPSAPPANDGSTNGTKLRYLRRLLSADLYNSATSLQNLGPSNFVPSNNNTMDSTDFGSFKNYDPRSPAPWAYSLANTYYRMSVERAADTPSVFEASNTSCPGKSFVVLFPTTMLNDSVYAALDSKGAYGYQTAATHGNSDLTGGTIYGSKGLALHPVTALLPPSESFFPGTLASWAAFGKSAANIDVYGANTGPWGSPWDIGTAPNQAKIQTMVVSIAIPGSYKFASDNSGRDAHEWYFRTAQWADPYRTDSGYGIWKKANGNPDDYPITDTADNGKVRYYPSADPASLEQNFKDLSNYIVAARATLSAPATPSTGARTTTQAYFGIFKTQRTPIWSGNLIGVGIARTEVKDASGVFHEDFTFYGAQGEDTRPIIDATTTPITYGISDFDNHHLWSAYDIFGNYRAADVPLDRPVYKNGLLGGSPVLWSNRTVYTVDPLGVANTMVSFNSGNATLVTHLATYLGATSANVQAFINYLRGSNPNDAGVTNRIDLMGDIIDSAPLAVELSKDRISGAMLTQWTTFESNSTTWGDLHARLLMVGTNTGQFHCFGEVAATALATTTDPLTGAVLSNQGKVSAYATELWSFIPQDVLKKLYDTYLNRAIEDSYKHPYLVDGDPAIYHKDLPSGTSLRGDTRVSANEDAVVIFGERKGGRSYWALKISDASGGSASPTNPQIVWSVQPLLSADAAIKTMGMSTSVPTFAVVQNGSTDSLGTPVVFLGGGYANNEVNARYRAIGTITALQGMGQLVLALNPLTGTELARWDMKDDLTYGCVAGGVTPVTMFLGSPYAQRIYWADYQGNMLAVGTKNNTGAATGFRLDASDITNWGKPRYIRKGVANLAANPSVPQQRFTNKPDAFKLANGFPVYIKEADGTQLRPVTVMVTVGAGDRNNPTDADESMSVTGASGTFTAPAAPPKTDRLYVWADRQDSEAQGLDLVGILDSTLAEILDSNVGTWPTKYSTNDPVLDPTNASYLWTNHNGYFFTLLDGTLSTAYGGITHDKLLVSPLAKDSALFFSLFNINGNTGFDCSANQFTRTFRECDILRPLAMDTQVKKLTTVGNVDDQNRNSDDCSGLAFYFNSLSSQLTDAGDRVVQGGAVSSKQSSFDAQTGQNTPDIKAVKDTSKNRGFRLRSWRVVR